MSDEQRSGQPIVVKHATNQCRVDDMMKENCWIKERDIALMLGTVT